MYIATNFVSRQVSTSSQTASAPTASGSFGQPAANTQTVAIARPSTQGPASGGSVTLGSQTLSTLLQTQEEAQAHGGGGGGSHHGGMKMFGLEAEEAAGEEGTQSLRRRKKLKMIKSPSLATAAEVDENGVAVSSETELNELSRSKKEDKAKLRM